MHVLLFKQDGKSIFVMREHRYALFCWRKAMEQHLIEKGSFLLHIDAHTDFTFNEQHALTSRILSRLSDAEAASFVKGLNPDNSEFIVPAMLAGIIKDGLAVYVRDGRDYGVRQEEMRVFTDGEPHRYHLCRKENLGSLPFYLQEHPIPEHFILDIDLDYFTYKNEQLYPKHPEDLMHQLDALRPLWDKADIITIALEPECCGGKTHCKEILNAFDSFLCQGLKEAEKLL